MKRFKYTCLRHWKGALPFSLRFWVSLTDLSEIKSSRKYSAIAKVWSEYARHNTEVLRIQEHDYLCYPLENTLFH